MKKRYLWQLPPSNSLAYRFRIIIIVLIFVLAGFLIGAYFFLANYQKNIQTITYQRNYTIQYTLKVEAAVSRILALYENYMGEKNLIARDKAETTWRKELRAYSDSLFAITETAADEDILENVKIIRQNLSRLDNHIDVLSRTEWENRKKVSLQVKQIEAIQENIRKAVAFITNSEENYIVDTQKYLSQQVQNAFYATLFALAVIVGIFIFYQQYIINRIEEINALIAKRLEILKQGDIPPEMDTSVLEFEQAIGFIQDVVMRFRRLKALAEDVGRGNFETTLRVFDGKGEIGNAITNMRLSLANVAKENEERNWINEGFAKFSNILREDKNDQAFYDSIITELVKYLEINQGAIFVLENQKLELAAAFAYNKRRYFEKTIQMGEGLVGAAWREQDSFYLNDVPKDYVHITSGLGGATPKAILIVPLLANNQFFGVLELASFEEILSYKQRFVKGLSESIAVTIARVQSNARNRQILEDSNALSEQVKAQEEEMSQNMEQLLSVQEAMEQQIGLMSQKWALVDKSCLYSEMNTNGYYTEVNENMSKVSGYSIEELKGAHYSLLLRHKSVSANKDWQMLLQGKALEGEYTRYKKNNEKYWVYEVIVPYKNPLTNEVERIFSLGIDISAYKQALQKLASSEETLGTDQA